MYIQEAFTSQYGVIARYTRAANGELATNPQTLAVISAGIRTPEPTNDRIAIPSMFDVAWVDSTREHPSSSSLATPTLPNTETANTIDELVEKARKTWAKLVEELGEVASIGYQLSEKEPPVSSRLILPDSVPVETPGFRGYVAEPYEIDALNAIVRAIPTPPAAIEPEDNALRFGYL